MNTAALHRKPRLVLINTFRRWWMARTARVVVARAAPPPVPDWEVELRDTTAAITHRDVVTAGLYMSRLV